MTHPTVAGTGAWPGRTVPAVRRRGTAKTRYPDREIPVERSSTWTLQRVERMTAFMVPLAVFATVGAFLALRYHAIGGDAQARLANSYYVFFSRDPHLSAVGFVWNPLSSITDMPVLLFKDWWPPLASDAFAASVVSAIFMAAAAYQLYRFSEDLELRRIARWVLWLCFVANPMIVDFAANGFSEALFILTIVTTIRYLTMWLAQPDLRPLMISALMLALAYLARNEAAAAAAAATVLVFLVTYRRTSGSRTARRMGALTDSVLYASPFVLAFVGWAAISWIVVGHPFEQMSSAYGTTSQLKIIGAGTIPLHAHGRRIIYGIKAVESMAPLLPLLIATWLWKARQSRDLRVLATLTVGGGVVAFEILAYALGQTLGSYRYFMYGIPLMAMLAVGAASPLGRPPKGSRKVTMLVGRRRLPLAGSAGSMLVAALVIMAVVPGVFTTGYTLETSAVAGAERSSFQWILWPNSPSSKTDPQRYIPGSARQIARQIDAMHLQRGQIMVDDFTPCVPPLLLDSAHPRQFVIPNDQDFQEKLGVPYQFGVRYLMVPPVTGYGTLDAVNRAYPGMYDTGQGIATLVSQINLKGCPDFRLYKLLPQKG